MAIESFFIQEGIKETEIEDFLKKKFDKADYSHIEIQRTPLGTRIIVYASKPGLVIGKSGTMIKEITDYIREKFGLDNPMLDVKEVENPFLDAQVVANKIAKSIEKGSFYKKIINFYLDEIMKNGAIGVQIKIAGKLGGERGRFQKFKAGYIKHAGYYADNIVDKGFATAIVKLGMIGVSVKIMKDMPEDLTEKVLELNEKKKQLSSTPDVQIEQQQVQEKTIETPEKEEKTPTESKEVKKENLFAKKEESETKTVDEKAEKKPKEKVNKKEKTTKKAEKKPKENAKKEKKTKK